MNPLDEFKDFVRARPQLTQFVLNGKYSWQQLYEIYTLYGETHEVWQQLNKSESMPSFDIMEFISKIDINALIAGLQGLEKVLDLFGNYLENSTHQEL